MLDTHSFVGLGLHLPPASTRTPICTEFTGRFYFQKIRPLLHSQAIKHLVAPGALGLFFATTRPQGRLNQVPTGSRTVLAHPGGAHARLHSLHPAPTSCAGTLGDAWTLFLGRERTQRCISPRKQTPPASLHALCLPSPDWEGRGTMTSPVLDHFLSPLRQPPLSLFQARALNEDCALCLASDICSLSTAPC